MSIWASQSVCGERDDESFDGTVVSYIEGWSNHYPGDFPPLVEEPRYKTRKPTNDLTEETPASIGTGWLPPWVVPGHREEFGEDIDTVVGPWLRLDVMLRRVSIWSGPEIGNQDMVSVCLNEDAVQKLRDNLTTWLERDKVHPQAVTHA